MSDLYNNMYNPDVLTCLANLSNDEVFTPPDVANAMLDMLPQELFESPDTTFLDPACKSGVFLREITKRLDKGLEKKIPNKQVRIGHILHKQVYGIAITELTSLMSRRSLYCSKYADSIFSVSKFDNVEGNIRYKRIKHTWKNKRCIYCGASQGELNRGDLYEEHAYEFIHTYMLKELIDNMKFDVVISNPPYQMNDGGNGISASPIYHMFIKQAIKLNPKYLTMIVPSRWFAGGKGMDSFRDTMLNDDRVKCIYDFMSSKDCFPGVDIAGGVNYFLWDRDYHGDCSVFNCGTSSNELVLQRPLNEFPVFIRDNRALGIIHKVLNSNDELLSNHTFTRNPFGFTSKDRGLENQDSNHCIKLLSSGGEGYVSMSQIKRNKEYVDKYKVSIGKIVPSNGEVDTNPLDGYKVTTTPRIINPMVVMTESYLMVHAFDSEKEAESFRNYMALKFPRFMMKHTLSSMNIATQNFQFVPFLNYDRFWTDQELYDRYNLDKAEREYVEQLIRTIDLD